MTNFFLLLNINLYILVTTSIMEYVKGLFLGNQTNPTIKVNEKEHIFRSRHAENGFVSTPLMPELKKEECTISRVWADTVKANSTKSVFGSRPLVNVSIVSNGRVKSSLLNNGW